MRFARSVVVAAVLVSGGAGAAQADPVPPPNPQPFGLPALPALPTLPGLIQSLVPPPPLPAANPAAPGAPSAPAAGADAQDSAPGQPSLSNLAAAIEPSPTGDELFDDAPADLAGLRPGDVIEVRDVTDTAAGLISPQVTRALLIKYRSTDAQGAPTFATATLVVPQAAWTGPGSRPVIVHNLAIDSLGKQCTAGFALAHGETENFYDRDFAHEMQLGLADGYAVLYPDHEGSDMAYAEPVVAGHVVLDAIRALRAQLPGEFGTSRFALTGYSGGAIAVHGAVALMDSYAPELDSVVVGAALGGLPADYGLAAGAMNGNLASGIMLAATLGMAREHPELLPEMNNAAQWVATSPMKDRCTFTFQESGLLQLPMDVAASVPDPLHSPVAERLFAYSRLDGRKSPVPLYIYHGEQEFWVPEQGAKNLFRQQCDLGVPAVYRGVVGEHLSGEALGFDDMVTWVQARLNGTPATNEC